MDRKWIPSIVLAIALAGVGVWGYGQYLKNREYAIFMDNLYQKSFYELVGHTGNIENKLSKFMVSGDRNWHMLLLSDVWRHAAAAGEDLGELPLGHLTLRETSKFMNQLSDYCNYLAKKVGEGKTISLDEMKNMEIMRNTSVQLSNDLRVLENRINEGGVKWGEVMRAETREGVDIDSDNAVIRQFSKIEKTGIDYPVLIYDGPFSEVFERRINVRMKGERVGQEEAQRIAAKFVGENRINRIEAGPEGHGDIDTWGVNVFVEGRNEPLFLSISKRGGKVVNMLSDGDRRSIEISLSQARQMAERFLEDKGYPGMVATYQQHYDGVAIFNFASSQQGIIMYPDLVKVKVSLEDGSVIGLDTKSYIIAHKKRNIKQPEISETEAQKMLNQGFLPKSHRLAIIPTEGGSERLCHEFKGKYAGEDFIVYIDAKTGKEANILKIIHTENGMLVM